MNKQVKIVGCGIAGATLANLLANKGWKVTIYEKRSFIGGNCYDYYNRDGILIHKFGPHIFHTSNTTVFKFISKFTTLNKYVNKVLVSVDGKVFPLPINFASMRTIAGNEVVSILKKIFKNKKTITFFELSRVKHPLVRKLTKYLYKNVYANYSTKMWGVKFTDIDPNTINRVKILLNDEHNYFPDDKYQGLPVGGYSLMINKMLKHTNIKVLLSTNALNHITFGKSILIDKRIANYPIVYCGSIDEAVNYKFGTLPYRSLNIKFKTVKKNKFQDAAVVNYPADPKMTRITEYKQMTFQKVKNLTTISKEYPGQFNLKSKLYGERYYPIVNKQNIGLYNKYVAQLKKYKNLYLLGRLSQYKYYDMDDAIQEAFNLAKRLENE